VQNPPLEILEALPTIQIKYGSEEHKVVLKEIEEILNFPGKRK
jgi:hypothetical protein